MATSTQHYGQRPYQKQLMLSQNILLNKDLFKESSQSANPSVNNNHNKRNVSEAKRISKIRLSSRQRATLHLFPPVVGIILQQLR
jgi:hypothetical protein